MLEISVMELTQEEVEMIRRDREEKAKQEKFKKYVDELSTLLKNMKKDGFCVKAWYGAGCKSYDMVAGVSVKDYFVRIG